MGKWIWLGWSWIVDNLSMGFAPSFSNNWTGSWNKKYGNYILCRSFRRSLGLVHNRSATKCEFQYSSKWNAIFRRISRYYMGSYPNYVWYYPPKCATLRQLAYHETRDRWRPPLGQRWCLGNAWTLRFSLPWHIRWIIDYLDVRFGHCTMCQTSPCLAIDALPNCLIHCQFSLARFGRNCEIYYWNDQSFNLWLCRIWIPFPYTAGRYFHYSSNGICSYYG